MKRAVKIRPAIGGLILGNLLAKKGHNVTIFESISMPGAIAATYQCARRIK